MAAKNGKHVNGPPIPILDHPEALEDPKAEERWPAVCWYLQSQYRNGKCEREASTISITINGPQVVVTLRCETEQKKTQFTTLVFFDLFDQLEAYLQSGHVVWLKSWSRQKKDRQEANKKVN